ncbi:MAG: metal-dependent hydrolase [Acidimicrobiia bacterium]|nr:metal-dependent hydrolase [Acidimicrobiia bacterium]MDH3470616.1 metal-dependent hydrolase [Acidimicrobiia bacterium]
MILWHLGGTVALVRYLFRDPAMDTRLLLVGALLPDLIDKPIGRFFFRSNFDSGQIFGHTLLFSAALMVAVLLVTKRAGSYRRVWMPLAIGSLVHLVLDFMWTQPETFLWPALGDFSPAESGNLTDAFAHGLTDPWVMAGEVVGLAYLVWLWRKEGFSRGARRRQYLSGGRLISPLGGDSSSPS